MINLGENSHNFFVQSTSEDNAEFLNRQKNIFGKLDAVIQDKESSIEKHNHNKRNIASVVEDKRTSKKQRQDTRQFRGQESIFKRPEAPPPARFLKNIPDYQRHPQKWTKYTLSDVSQEDMSDRSNTAAAMSFLQELKAKRELENMDVDGNEPKQITFKKPSNLRNKEIRPTCDDSCSSSFRSSKVVMPEYVVGEKKNLKKNKTKVTDKPKIEKSKEIKLGHLEEEDVEY